MDDEDEGPGLSTVLIAALIDATGRAGNIKYTNLGFMWHEVQIIVASTGTVPK